MINEHPSIANSAAIRSVYPHQDSDGGASLVYHAQIALWCPIYHPKYGLFGLVVLGRRGDLDPYHPQDIHELQQLFNAAGLAFAHSYLFAKQVESEQTIRQLFSRLQRAQDETAKTIAQELHDEIINMHIRLNIESIQKLLRSSADAAMSEGLSSIMESEHEMAQSLRMICESLHPAGIDDPLGLTTLLRGQLERLRPHYHGTLSLQVDHSPCSVAPHVQRELMRITNEAVVNAMKHAQATAVDVCLTYPVGEDSRLTITIRDNGTLDTQIREKPGHFGLRNMVERTHMIGGTLDIQCRPYQGTMVVITIPSLNEPEDRQLSFVYPMESTSYDQIRQSSYANSANWHVDPDLSSLERHPIFR
jgi:signal transduction histidine kinase